MGPKDSDSIRRWYRISCVFSFLSAILLFHANEFSTGKHAGIAMYFNNFSTWRCKPGIYLEELFVSEKYRRLGIGKMFLSELAKEVLKINGGRLEWAVLKWNKSAIKF